MDMDIIIKCLAFIGAMSLIGSLVMVLLALCCAKETATTYHCNLDSMAKPRSGTIIPLDLRRPRKSASYRRKIWPGDPAKIWTQ